MVCACSVLLLLLLQTRQGCLRILGGVVAVLLSMVSSVGGLLVLVVHLLGDVLVARLDLDLGLGYILLSLLLRMVHLAKLCLALRRFM